MKISWHSFKFQFDLSAPVVRIIIGIASCLFFWPLFPLIAFITDKDLRNDNNTH